MKTETACIHGKITSSCEIADFIFTETVYAPRLRVPNHSHDYACFYTVFRGGFTETFGKTAVECKPFSFVFRPVGKAHSNQVENETAR